MTTFTQIRYMTRETNEAPNDANEDNCPIIKKLFSKSKILNIMSLQVLLSTQIYINKCRKCCRIHQKMQKTAWRLITLSGIKHFSKYTTKVSLPLYPPW